jgi:hypothetical protein
MKISFLRYAFHMGLCSGLLLPAGLPAQTQAVVTAPPVTAPATVQLPYGVSDVLKLSKAQISEDIIVNFVQNSGTVYNLQPRDIVYLHEQGVSDRVINAMIDQRRIAAQAAAAQAQMPPVQQQQPAPAYSEQPVVAAPAAPPSSLYVIPYPAASYAYYDYPYPYYSYSYYPYYSSYCGPYWGGYCGPSISLGFRFGGGSHHFDGFHHFGGGFSHFGGPRLTATAHFGGGGHFGGTHFGGSFGHHR